MRFFGGGGAAASLPVKDRHGKKDKLVIRGAVRDRKEEEQEAEQDDRYQSIAVSTTDDEERRRDADEGRDAAPESSRRRSHSSKKKQKKKKKRKSSSKSKDESVKRGDELKAKSTEITAKSTEGSARSKKKKKKGDKKKKKKSRKERSRDYNTEDDIPMIDRVPTAFDYHSDESEDAWLEEKSRASRYTVDPEKTPRIEDYRSDEEDGEANDDDKYSTTKDSRNIERLWSDEESDLFFWHDRSWLDHTPREQNDDKYDADVDVMGSLHESPKSKKKKSPKESAKKTEKDKEVVDDEQREAVPKDDVLKESEKKKSPKESKKDAKKEADDDRNRNSDPKDAVSNDSDKKREPYPLTKVTELEKEMKELSKITLEKMEKKKSSRSKKAAERQAGTGSEQAKVDKDVPKDQPKTKQTKQKSPEKKSWWKGKKHHDIQDKVDPEPEAIKNIQGKADPELEAIENIQAKAESEPQVVENASVVSDTSSLTDPLDAAMLKHEKMDLVVKEVEKKLQELKDLAEQEKTKFNEAKKAQKTEVKKDEKTKSSKLSLQGKRDEKTKSSKPPLQEPTGQPKVAEESKGMKVDEAKKDSIELARSASNAQVPPGKKKDPIEMERAVSYLSRGSKIRASLSGLFSKKQAEATVSPPAPEKTKSKSGKFDISTPKSAITGMLSEHERRTMYTKSLLTETEDSETDAAKKEKEIAPKKIEQASQGNTKTKDMAKQPKTGKKSSVMAKAKSTAIQKKAVKQKTEKKSSAKAKTKLEAPTGKLSADVKSVLTRSPANKAPTSSAKELDEYSVDNRAQEGPALAQCLQFYNCVGAANAVNHVADKVTNCTKRTYPRIKASEHSQEAFIVDEILESRTNVGVGSVTPKPTVEIILEQDKRRSGWQDDDESFLDEAPDLSEVGLRRVPSIVLDVSQMQLHLDEDSEDRLQYEAVERGKASAQSSDMISITSIRIPSRPRRRSRSRSRQRHPTTHEEKEEEMLLEEYMKTIGKKGRIRRMMSRFRKNG
jgi:hypothetical protein